MSTCFLNVPDPDDQPFDDDEPNKPIPPGDRWCSLWSAREPGGPRLPCHPSIEGTADEWTLIAGAIEAGAPRAFGRVAFAPQAGGGEFWSPRNSTGDRDHVRLTTAELVDLAADIRAKLAPPAACLGCAAERGPAIPADLRVLLEALVATRDALDALPEIDEATAIAKFDAEAAVIAWTRANVGER